MALSPITKSRLPSTSDAPNGPQQMQAAIGDLETYAAMRFDSRADRNARLVGIVPKDGMLCYLTDVQCWETYRGGVWTNAPWVPEFQDVAAVGATWDGSARLIHRASSHVVSVGANGTVSFPIGTFPHGLMIVSSQPGDYTPGQSAQVTCVMVHPILSQMTARNVFNGIALSQNALSPVTSGTTIRVNYDIWGW